MQTGITLHSYLTHFFCLSPVFIYPIVFLILRYVIEVARENDPAIILQPAGSQGWCKDLSIDEMGEKLLVVESLSQGLWIFGHDGE